MFLVDMIVEKRGNDRVTFTPKLVDPVASLSVKNVADRVEEVSQRLMQGEVPFEVAMKVGVEHAIAFSHPPKN